MKEAVMLSMGGKRGHENLLRAYNQSVREELEASLQFHKEVTTEEDLMRRAMSGEFNKLSYVFSTWGMTAQAESDIRQYTPNLEAVFYAAGSVQEFARPFLKAGVRVYSAFRANAVPVAEYTLAQIILSGKGYFQAERIYKSSRDSAKAASFSHGNTGNYGQTVGLLGAGAIGKLVIALLKQFNYRILVFDPFLSDTAADDLGVQKADLMTIFSTADIISNHLANNSETKGMIKYEHFSLMRPYTSFINTGRGAQVVEADLVRALEEDETRTALLDVTWPEPLAKDSPFFDLKNAFNTPHIAGSQSLEIARMGQYMLEAWQAHENAEKSEHEVVAEMLASMA